MRRSCLNLLLTACLCAIAPSMIAQAPAVESRIAAQNVLFEEIYQASLKSNPEFATCAGQADPAATHPR